MEKNNLTPERDWRALAIYQIMVGSFVHSDKGAEGYDNMWGPEGERKDGNLRDGGLKSAFDFDGKQLISGAMDGSDNGGLDNGWDDVMRIYSSPADRGYSPDDVLPNLFLSNHDGVRVGDSFYDGKNEINLMTRFAILAGYPGPVTIYYGDESKTV